MNNENITTATIHSWKSGTLSAQKAMEVIYLVSQGHKETPAKESMADFWASYLTGIDFKTVDKYFPPKARVPEVITKGQHSYELRQTGLSWADVAMKLSMDYWQARRAAQSYAKKERKEWPITIN